MDSQLFNAILSMDSHNRGYNSGIDFNTYDSNGNLITASDDPSLHIQIGNATIYRSAGDAPAMADGFYAIAYQYTIDSNLQVQPGTGQVTIAYRGTDQFLPGNGIGSDITNAYGVGAGFPDQTQSELAFAFYRAVSDAQAGVGAGLSDPFNADISLTGHSMGGGLAGSIPL